MDSVKFYETDFCDARAYDNARKLASYVDGLKLSMRKCVYTMLDMDIKEERKLESLKNIIAEYTQYIHGADSLVGVFVNLARNYVGSNNIPLFTTNGHFGIRLNNEHSAGRYIKSKQRNYLDKIFMKDDFDSLIKQSFEGREIEPRYFIPIIPLILINGSIGLSTGYSQLILPRNFEEVKKQITNILDNKNLERIMPSYNGYKGNILRGTSSINAYVFTGTFKRINKNEIEITELPIGYELESYIGELEKLLEKKVIVDYKDLSDTKTDTFLFRVKLKDNDSMTDEEILNTLKLVNKVTENFTVLNEENKVKVFDNELEILKSYVKLRLHYYEKRKANKLAKLEQEIKHISNKILFINGFMCDDIQIFKKSQEDIIKQLEEKNFDKIDNSYSYLLNMPISSLTKEKVKDLEETLSNKQKEHKNITKKDIKDWYKEDLETLTIALKKENKC